MANIIASIVFFVFYLFIVLTIRKDVRELKKNYTRRIFEQKHHYRKVKDKRPYHDCLSCTASTSEPGEPYDKLHCFEMHDIDDVVDECKICDLWKN
jgi:hypothetical protein